MSIDAHNRSCISFCVWFTVYPRVYWMSLRGARRATWQSILALSQQVLGSWNWSIDPYAISSMTWSVFLLLLPLVYCCILRNILTCGSCILKWMTWDHMFYVQWLFSLNCLLLQRIMLCRFYMSWSRCSRFAWLLIVYRFSRRDFVSPQNDVRVVWLRPSSEWRECFLLRPSSEWRVSRLTERHCEEPEGRRGNLKVYRSKVRESGSDTM